jgi:hypothetical protein
LIVIKPVPPGDVFQDGHKIEFNFFYRAKYESSQGGGIPAVIFRVVTKMDQFFLQVEI